MYCFKSLLPYFCHELKRDPCVMRNFLCSFSGRRQLRNELFEIQRLRLLNLINVH